MSSGLVAGSGREQRWLLPREHAEGECCGLAADLRKIQQSSADDSLLKLGSGQAVDRHTGCFGELPCHLKGRDRLAIPIALHRNVKDHRIKRQSSDLIQHGLQWQLIQPAGANWDANRPRTLLASSFQGVLRLQCRRRKRPRGFRVAVGALTPAFADSPKPSIAR